MADFKEIIKRKEYQGRYDGFTILENPVLFSELFKDKNISLVQLHDVNVFGLDGKEYICGFAGTFKWKNNKIIPLDGDSYSDKMEVLGYEWFNNYKSIDILVKEW